MSKLRGKTQIFGQQGERLYVNSAHSINCEWVCDTIPNASNDGSVPLSAVQNDLGVSDIGETIVGNVALRRHVAQTLKELTGHDYSNVRCNQIIDGMDFLGRWHNLPWTLTSSEGAHLARHLLAAGDKHRVALVKARAARTALKKRIILLDGY